MAVVGKRLLEARLLHGREKTVTAEGWLDIRLG
jgi:hypothetical protein